MAPPRSPCLGISAPPPPPPTHTNTPSPPILSIPMWPGASAGDGGNTGRGGIAKPLCTVTMGEAGGVDVLLPLQMRVGRDHEVLLLLGAAAGLSSCRVPHPPSQCVLFLLLG